MKAQNSFQDTTAFEKALIIAFGLVLISFFINPLAFVSLFPLALLLSAVETSGYFFSETQIAVVCGFYSTSLILGVSLMIEPMVRDFWTQFEF